MRTPGYRWTCFACGQANEPQAGECATCGFAAFAKGEEIAAARAAERPQASRSEAPSAQTGTEWLERPSSILMFFPEGLIAAVLVLASPIWFIMLLIQGKAVAALVLSAGVTAGVWLGREAWLAKERWLLYCAVVLLLFTAGGTFSASD